MSLPPADARRKARREESYAGRARPWAAGTGWWPDLTDTPFLLADPLSCSIESCYDVVLDLQCRYRDASHQRPKPVLEVAFRPDLLRKTIREDLLDACRGSSVGHAWILVDKFVDTATAATGRTCVRLKCVADPSADRDGDRLRPRAASGASRQSRGLDDAGDVRRGGVVRLVFVLLGVVLLAGSLLASAVVEGSVTAAGLELGELEDAEDLLEGRRERVKSSTRSSLRGRVGTSSSKAFGELAQAGKRATRPASSPTSSGTSSWSRQLGPGSPPSVLPTSAAAVLDRTEPIRTQIFPEFLPRRSVST